MISKLWIWLPLWGKILLVVAISALLGLVVYFVFKHIVLIVVLILVVILVLYELGWLTQRNYRKVRHTIQSGKRMVSTESKGKDTASPNLSASKPNVDNTILPSSFRRSQPEVSTSQEDKPENAPQDELQFRKKFPRQYWTTDGHNVRSKSEVIIDNWLRYKGITHDYEKRLPVKEQIYCDFYIEKGDRKVYIEYWGLDSNPEYRERKQKKQEIYKKYGFQLIELTDNEISTLDGVLSTRLREFGIEIE